MDPVPWLDTIRISQKELHGALLERIERVCVPQLFELVQHCSMLDNAPARSRCVDLCAEQLRISLEERDIVRCMSMSMVDCPMFQMAWIVQETVVNHNDLYKRHIGGPPLGTSSGSTSS